MPGLHPDRLHPDILSTIGRTPVVRIARLAPAHVELYAKLEAFNPLGSVKDRLALGVIEAAERDGSLRPGQIVVEATSGNTGISLAMVCARKGYPLVVVMAENFSVERRKLMRFLGAQVVLTPAAEKGSGMLAKARELAERHGWFLARQFENPANPEIHARTTAREILADFGGRGPDAWVSGFGSGGTLLGVGRVLKAESPATRIVACEPDNAAMLASGIAQAAGASHPAFRPHLMQGWSPDFVSPLASEALAEGLIDELRGVSGTRALEVARELATREGILCGPTGGATMAAALEVAREAPAGARILAMLPDTGERYLSTPLFAGIPETMTEAEQAIAASTPGYRFDAPAPLPMPATVPAAAMPAPTPEALAHVERIVGDPAAPVVMFALEWCEFCWSVRRLLQAMEVPFLSVDLDGEDYRRDDRGGEVRKALRAMTGAPTIPQIFIAGRHVGGATDLFDACNDGRLARWLRAANIPGAAPPVRDAYDFLPGWLHPRRA